MYLLRAFAGESEARNKYTYFASKAKKEGFEQIAALSVSYTHLAGAWIEMKHSIIGQKDRPSLHSRERGLKWLGVPVFIGSV